METHFHIFLLKYQYFERSFNSLGSKENYKKNLGVCGTKRGNLHTGSVFGAEQDWDGYTFKF